MACGRLRRLAGAVHGGAHDPAGMHWGGRRRRCDRQPAPAHRCYKWWCNGDMGALCTAAYGV